MLPTDPRHHRSPRWHTRRGQARCPQRCQLSLPFMAHLLCRGQVQRKPASSPACFYWGEGTRSTSSSAGYIGAKKDEPEGRATRCQGDYSSSPSFSCLYIYFFRTILKIFSSYLRVQLSPTYPLWDDQSEPLGPENHEFLLSSWPAKTKDLL